jgi:hypothetical protein
VRLAAGGCAGDVPLPAKARGADAFPALLITSITALEAKVPLGAKVATKERAAEGRNTTGKAGSPLRLKKLPVRPMDVIVKAAWPVLVITNVCLDEVLIGTPPKSKLAGETLIPTFADPIVKALERLSVSNPDVTETVRTPGAAAESILTTAVALVKEVTISEATVTPAPKLAWVTFGKKCVNWPVRATERFR